MREIKERIRVDGRRDRSIEEVPLQLRKDVQVIDIESLIFSQASEEFLL